MVLWCRTRKREELTSFKELIKRGDTVLEIGAHIGYVTQIFEELVGGDGKVFVAEPTEFSCRFLLKNKRKDTKILPIAVSDSIGKADFFTEQFGGFTNSIVRDFTENSKDFLSQTQRNKKTSLKKVQVDTSTVDAICSSECITPQFIKVDVEGGELAVLKGAKDTLRSTYALMVEVSRNHEDVYNLLYDAGFKPLPSDDRKAMNNYEGGNIFFVNESAFDDNKH